MRTDLITSNFIGAGEDAAFEILKSLTGLQERHIRDFPSVGIYRQLPVTVIYDSEQMEHLADFHRKSSIDIFLIKCNDIFSQKECRIAVRVEGKKGDLKMLRQSVQRNMLSRHCLVVDLHKRECKELFKDRINADSMREVLDSFRTEGVSI